MSGRTVGARIAEDLRGAAGILNQAGWSQNVGLHDPETGAHDITGAIYVAVGYHQRDAGGRYRAHPLRNSAHRRSMDCLNWLARSLPTSTVSEFNDRVCPSQSAAIDTLLASAESAEQSIRTPYDAQRLLP